MVQKQSISLTGILVQDRNERGFTAYFAEFPEAIADGKTKEEAQANLFEAFRTMLEARKTDVPGLFQDDSITEQKFEFELA